MEGEIAGEVGGALLAALEGVEVRDERGARDARGRAGHAVEDVAAGLRGFEVAASDGEVEWSVGLRELDEELGVAVDAAGLGFDVGAEVLPVGV